MNELLPDGAYLSAANALNDTFDSKAAVSKNLIQHVADRKVEVPVASDPFSFKREGFMRSPL